MKKGAWHTGSGRKVGVNVCRLRARRKVSEKLGKSGVKNELLSGSQKFVLFCFCFFF